MEVDINLIRKYDDAFNDNDTENNDNEYKRIKIEQTNHLKDIIFIVEYKRSNNPTLLSFEKLCEQWNIAIQNKIVIHSITFKYNEKYCIFTNIQMIFWELCAYNDPDNAYINSTKWGNISMCSYDKLLETLNDSSKLNQLAHTKKTDETVRNMPFCIFYTNSNDSRVPAFEIIEQDWATAIIYNTTHLWSYIKFKYNGKYIIMDNCNQNKTWIISVYETYHEAITRSEKVINQGYVPHDRFNEILTIITSLSYWCS